MDARLGAEAQDLAAPENAEGIGKELARMSNLLTSETDARYSPAVPEVPLLGMLLVWTESNSSSLQGSLLILGETSVGKSRMFVIFVAVSQP